MNENSITISAPENANVSVFFCSVEISEMIEYQKKKKIKLR